MNKRGFASDNNAGVDPDIMRAIAAVNQGHVIAYGEDPLTQRTVSRMKQIFGQKSEIFFVFTGTGANVLGLSSATNSYHAVICPDTAHIHVDECGAPEKFSGCKLLTVSTPDGKLTVDMIRSQMHGIGFEHHVQPRVVSITQSTELGTVYSLEEIREISDYVHGHHMLLHMDGARISNAAVALDCGFNEMTGEAGVDILSFGGTKNGMMYGEAVVFFDPELGREFKYRRKQGMQLASKMRFIAAQFEAFLGDELWKKNAEHANQMARNLYQAVRHIEGVEITQKVESNAVFARIPRSVISRLQEEFFFYVWDEETCEVRWMCSYDTTVDDISGFASQLESLMDSRSASRD